MDLLREHPYITRLLAGISIYFLFKDILLLILSTLFWITIIVVSTLCIVIITVTAKGDTERFDMIIGHVLNGTRTVVAYTPK